MQGEVEKDMVNAGRGASDANKGRRAVSGKKQSFKGDFTKRIDEGDARLRVGTMGHPCPMVPKFGIVPNLPYFGDDSLSEITLSSLRFLPFAALLPFLAGFRRSFAGLEMNASQYIGRAWRSIDDRRQFVEINYQETDFPNGFEDHLANLVDTIRSGGVVLGVFFKERLVGFCSVNKELFGKKYKYDLLDQLFISKGLRNFIFVQVHQRKP